MIGKQFAIQPLSVQSHYTFQERQPASPDRQPLLHQSQIDSRINSFKIFMSGRKKRLMLKTQQTDTRAHQSTGVSQMTYTPVNQMNKTSMLSFSNAPFSQQSEGRRRSLMQQTQRTSSPVKTFVAYQFERDRKGQLLDTTTPMQELIQRVQDQRSQHSHLKWTTEKSLRETRRNMFQKAQQSYKQSSQASFFQKNMSTAENSIEQVSTLLRTGRGTLDGTSFIEPSIGLTKNIRTRETSLEHDQMIDQSRVLSQSPLALSGFKTHAALAVLPNFSNFRFRMLPGQENTLRSRYSNSLESQQHNNQTSDESSVQAIDIARLLIKAQKHQAIKYELVERDVMQSKIPEDQLYHQISEEYKRIIEQNRGKQVFSSFSKTQRFKSNRHAESFSERKFSLLDVHEGIFKSKNPMPEFAKQAGRTNVFFTPEQMQIMKEAAEAYKVKMQKIQQFKEMVKDNEKKYAINKTYSLRFYHDEHANVKNMKPFIKQMISVIKDHAEDTKLQHYIVTRLQENEEQ